MEVSNDKIVVLSVDTLQSIIYDAVCKAMAEHTASAAVPHTDGTTDARTYTIDEVCDLLHVTRQTLNRWSKANYLCPVKVGKRTLYSASDVNNLINA